MRRINSYVNRVPCRVVHLVQVQTAYRFVTAKLADEIRSRCHAVVDVADAEGASCFNLLLGDLDDLPTVTDVIKEIEHDVKNAREQRRLLALCKEG